MDSYTAMKVQALQPARRPIYGTVRRKVVAQSVQAKTYIVFITLDCGHKTSYTRSAKNLSNRLKSTGCYQCWKAQ